MSKNLISSKNIGGQSPKTGINTTEDQTGPALNKELRLKAEEEKKQETVKPADTGKTE